MKFKVDENIPVEVASVLAAAAHDAMTVPDQRLSGQPDMDVMAICQREGRAILTLDLDFADIRAYPPADHAGIVVMRLARLDKNHILNAIQRLIPSLDQEILFGKLWIVDETTIRIRS